MYVRQIAISTILVICDSSAKCKVRVKFTPIIGLIGALCTLVHQYNFHYRLVECEVFAVKMVNEIPLGNDHDRWSSPSQCYRTNRHWGDFENDTSIINNASLQHPCNLPSFYLYALHDQNFHILHRHNDSAWVLKTVHTWSYIVAISVSSLACLDYHVLLWFIR